MSDSIRELIIQDIVTQLEILSGYGSVYRGRVYLDYLASPTAELPGIVVLPGAESAVKQYGEQVMTMSVEIFSVQVVGDGNNPSVLAESTLAVLIENMIGGRGNISRINSLSYSGGGGIEYPTDTEQILVVKLDISIEYATNIGDPYTQTSI